ncbi:MAG: hypothetical protein WC775_04690 [Patescibacteria group bacterium]|jgi:hypothetical protein
MTVDRRRSISPHQFRYEDRYADEAQLVAETLDTSYPGEEGRTRFSTDVEQVLRGLRAQMGYFSRFDDSHILTAPEFSLHASALALAPTIPIVARDNFSAVVPWLDPRLSARTHGVLRHPPWYITYLSPVMLPNGQPIAHMRLAYRSQYQEDLPPLLTPTEIAIAFVGHEESGALQLGPGPHEGLWLVRHVAIDQPNMASHIQCHQVGTRDTALLMIRDRVNLQHIWQSGTPSTYMQFPNLGI